MTSSCRRPPRDTSYRLAVVTGKFPLVMFKGHANVAGSAVEISRCVREYFEGRFLEAREKDNDLARLSLWWEGGVPRTLFIDGILHLRAELTIRQDSTMSMQSSRYFGRKGLAFVTRSAKAQSWVPEAKDIFA
ncbi:hypothetical protein OPV22_020330 [Ensete ventricosum]|uniref:Uncharacterized protein n=1 Tax=Ensete ventricosum TaxID=4639 RepID=A0AAV8QK31_ENSVE|nr:hypothetical protein OPV22_020330 [Ensete ventricosum]